MTSEQVLKNFLDAFDTYFEFRGQRGPSPQKVDDAKQAMFSAAMQAREFLTSWESKLEREGP